MSIQKVNHNVVKPFDAKSIAKSASSYGNKSNDGKKAWIDVNGWTDKVFTYEVDSSGSISLTVTAHISPQGAYELNNKTVTTDDYVAVVLASAASGAIAARVDASDVDDLQRPIRSIRFLAANGDATDASVVTAYIEGWS